MRENIIRNRGDYRQLLCYRKAEAIYDITYFFANKFLKQPDRTIDQMVQAARSGKQNIIEGYAAGATSIEAELRLFNVAKSSLKELLADYEDYLRTRNLRQWEQDSIEFKRAQELGKEHDDTEFWMNIVSTRSDEAIANIAIIILYQTDYLLHRFMEKVSRRFVDEGSFREKLSRVRKSEKNKKSPNDPNASNAPIFIFLPSLRRHDCASCVPISTSASAVSGRLRRQPRWRVFSAPSVSHCCSAALPEPMTIILKRGMS